MTESLQKNKVWLKKTGKITIGILVVLLVLGLAGRYSLKSDWLGTWVKNKIEQEANTQLNGTLSIKKLKGDLAKRVILYDIALIQAADTVAVMDSLLVDYSLWPLWEQKVQVNHVLLGGPRLFARQQSDGQWNLTTLVSASPSQTTPQDSPTASTFSLDIKNIALINGAFSARSSVFPDSSLNLAAIKAGGSFTWRDPAYRARLNQLSFDIVDEPVGHSTVQTSALATDESITLDKLLLNTGLSLFQMNGSYETKQGNLSLNLYSKPLSWKDVRSYYAKSPLEHDLHASLTLEGRWPELDLTLQAQAAGLDSLRWQTQFQVDSILTVQSSNLSIYRLNSDVLLDTTGLPSVSQLNADITGSFNLEQPLLSQLQGQWHLQGVKLDRYSIPLINGDVQLENQKMRARTRVLRGEEQWDIRLSASNIAEETSPWAMQLSGRNIDGGYWSGNSALQATTGNAQFTLSGKGFYPPGRNQSWKYDMKLSDINVNGQPIQGIAAGGQVTNEEIRTTGSVQIHKSSVQFSGGMDIRKPVQGYAIQVQTNEFNLAEIQGFEQLTTRLNGSIHATGRGYELASMSGRAVVQVDSSYINNALLSQFSGSVELADSVLQFNNWRLESAIAKGNLSARLHAIRYYDIQNRLDATAEIKDLNSLAPLLNLSKLQATGTLSGRLKPDESGKLTYNGTVELQDIQAGESFYIDSLRAEAYASLGEEKRYRISAGIKEPRYENLSLNDVVFFAEASMHNKGTRGRFDLTFHSPGSQSLNQQGSFSATMDSLTITTEILSIEGINEALSLKAPFSLTLNRQFVRMEPMTLTAENGSSLMLSLPVAGEQEVAIMASAERLNLADVQQTLLDDVFIGGIANFDMVFRQVADSLNMDFKGHVSDASYANLLTMDTIRVAAGVQQNIFKGSIKAIKNGALWADGFLEVPYQSGNPNTFGQNFFERPVSGRLTIPPANLENFKSLMNALGLAETTGFASFSGEISGTAGTPAFNATLQLAPLTTSGITLDSVRVGFNYEHTNRQLFVNSEVNSLSQKLAVLNARFPLFIDLKNLTVTPPQATDSIRADIITNNFRLGALNDFADPRVVRQIAGLLNGGVTVTGTFKSPEILGNINLSNGKFNIVPAGMTYSNIASTVAFQGETIQLSSFSMRGDKGTLTASGNITLNELIPEKLDIRIKANTFKLANTRDISLNISTNSRIGGTLKRPVVTGNLTVNNGFYYLTNFGEKSVEEIRLESEQPVSDSLQVDVYDNLAMDLRMDIANIFSIRNRRFLDMQIDMTGGVDIVKQANKPMQIFGVLEAQKGFAKPLGKTFTLDEGKVTFDGNPENPLLDITTQYKPPQPTDVTIFYKIQGRADDPRFIYESIPPMDKKNIISYTLFGQPFYGIDSWKQVVASPEGDNSAVSDLALNVMLDRVETLATQHLGIDVVQIDNTQTNSRSSTTLRTGWYLNEKTFFAVLNELSGSSPETEFLLEYFLKKNLKLILTQGQDNRTGVDISWQHDY